MKNNKVNYILFAALFVGIFAVAVIGYNALTKNYTPPQTELALPGSGDTVSADLGSEEAGAVPPEETEPTEEEEVIAPDFTVLDADGADVTLADRLEDGKPIVLNFWATWCGPCKSELPAFDKAAAEYADELTFMMINLTDGQVETVSGVKTFMEENGYTLPVYFDKKGSASGPYGASSIPLTYFITSDGVVAGGHMGSMSEETLYNYLGQLLELEKTVAEETP
ncbi:MAG: TlpA family protein disulfide reductase [Clostridia bacterium]|nr:TlpA family protein disulfide reductase [Clostridia bacterium]